MPLPVLLVISAFIGVGRLLINRKSKNVFISYYSKGDSRYKNLVMAWVNNNNFKLEFDDVSTDTKIQSSNIRYLKKRMRDRIDLADFVIVFIGEDTYQREWVAWEINEAIARNKKIIAVKEKRTHKSPDPILGCGAKWVYGFTEKGIREALESF